MSRVSVYHPEADIVIANELATLINPELPVVVICIGTDRSTGDALGPLVGTFLKMADVSLPIYGTLSKPVHARVLKDVLAMVREEHRDAQIIAVDCCLGSPENIGDISIDPGPLNPGVGVGKNLPEVGDISIKGVVNVNDFPDFFMRHWLLSNTRLHLVWRLASTIASGIMGSLEMYNYAKRNPAWQMIACSNAEEDEPEKVKEYD